MPKNKEQWADGGWTNTTYCKECQKYYNNIKRNKVYNIGRNILQKI